MRETDTYIFKCWDPLHDFKSKHHTAFYAISVNSDYTKSTEWL